MMMQDVVLATGNPGKAKELQRLLAPLNFTVRLQSEFGIGSAEETGLTFVENAILKARHAAEQAKLPTIADDSGLEVDYLQGAPGIYSSRFAGEEATDAQNNAKLLEALREIPEAQRSARFRAVVVYLRHAADPAPIIAQGVWEGRILTAEQGAGGFGYDPLFYIPSLECTSAELLPEEKNRLSHRGQALQQFQALIKA